MNKVAIIGFGNIGKRHLEGLLKSKHSLDIFEACFTQYLVFSYHPVIIW